MTDVVNHPAHYNSSPSGVEAIEICSHLNFAIGNTVKYLWRSDLKHKDAREDMSKARWYLRFAMEYSPGRHGGLALPPPKIPMLLTVINAENFGSVLRDVLELVVLKYVNGEEPHLAAALLRIEQEIEKVSHA